MFWQIEKEIGAGNCSSLERDSASWLSWTLCCTFSFLWLKQGLSEIGLVYHEAWIHGGGLRDCKVLCPMQ